MTKSILHHVNLNHLDFCDLRSMRGAIMSHPEPCGELNRPDKKRCQTPYEWYRLTDYPLGRKHIDLSQWGELIFCKPHTQLNNLSWTVLPAAVRSGSQLFNFNQSQRCIIMRIIRKYKYCIQNLVLNTKFCCETLDGADW